MVSLAAMSELVQNLVSKSTWRLERTKKREVKDDNDIKTGPASTVSKTNIQKKTQNVMADRTKRTRVLPQLSH